MKNDTAVRLGRTLAALRHNLGLTQTEFAKKAGVAASTYARHELGQDTPTAHVLNSYMNEVGLKVAEFYQVHELLFLARTRDAEGRGWWMALVEEGEDFEAEHEVLREKLRQFGNLQSDILEILLGKVVR
jgi:transcriptional regulator with XRE-family HTH domain